MVGNHNHCLFEISYENENKRYTNAEENAPTIDW
jgi:hypothetical protein